MWLMDAYRQGDRIALWIKTQESDVRILKDFTHTIYLDAVPEAKKLLDKHALAYKQVLRKTHLGLWKKVYAVTPPNDGYERFIADIEKGTRFRVPLYDADIKPEHMFLYTHDLTPCAGVAIEGEQMKTLKDSEPPVLKSVEMDIQTNADIRNDLNARIASATIDHERLFGDEKTILQQLAQRIKDIDPDVIRMEYAFKKIPFIAEKLGSYGIPSPLHRFDDAPLRYRGGKTFFSYGRVQYRDYAVRLHGRFLVDTMTFVGDECDDDAIMEMCQLSGTCFQQVASRSFGAVFQNSLLREMVQDNLLIPYKEKPLDKPLSLFEMLKSDRAGHTFDPQVGVHEDVAEIDFCSMYPWLIYNHNISAETLVDEHGPFEQVPGIPVSVSLQRKGLVPRALKPMLDKRMFYKAHPTAINKKRSKGLKWVLVSSYGYLRFREFKLGVASSHMAICAYARETLMQAFKLAEDHGFEVVHGLIDSLYIKKKGLTKQEVESYCDELGLLTGIPVSLEGMFRWICFLPSVNDPKRPVPTRYFGMFANGEAKARGIELRQRSAPLLIKHFQQQALGVWATCENETQMRAAVPGILRLYRRYVAEVPFADPSLLAINLCLTKSVYKTNNAQKRLVEALADANITIIPGMRVRFVMGQKGPMLLDRYEGKPDTRHYRALLERALLSLLQPLGHTKKSVKELLQPELQTTLYAFAMHVKKDEKRERDAIAVAQSA